MPNYTQNLNLFKYDPSTDGSMPFDVQKALNDNFDKIDSNSIGLSHITNCILEIPQRINYTLEDGTLTIKAGSVVIVPYGIEDLTSQYPVGATFLNDNFKVYDTQFEDDKFFVWAELVNDQVSTFTWSGTYNNNFLYIDILTNTQLYKQHKDNLSGETHPDNTEQHIWYDTINNVIQEYNRDKITIMSSSVTLPILVFDNIASVITNINQVFNGMGYIGSTIWVDKGVKGLIPNGRNADGSLNNIEHTIPKLCLQTISAEGKRDNLKIHYSIWGEAIGDYNNIGTDGTLHNRVVGEDGYFYDNGKLLKGFDLGIYSYDGSIVTNLKMKQFIRAVDYSDSSTVSGWSMPSDKYLDLTLGASGSTYTAPANGWLYIWKASTAVGQYIIFTNQTGSMANIIYAPTSSTQCRLILPLKKGHIAKIDYTLDGVSRAFRFIYVEGEV